MLKTMKILWCWWRRLPYKDQLMQINMYHKDGKVLALALAEDDVSLHRVWVDPKSKCSHSDVSLSVFEETDCLEELVIEHKLVEVDKNHFKTMGYA
jgi:hypothetical protein